MKSVYFIGGSPCCGKSTIAERIAAEYGFQYYKADDFLDKHIKEGAKDGNKWLKYIEDLSMDELWLRQPQIINDEALRTYENLFPYFLSALEKLSSDTPIITEGACFLPFMVNRARIDKAHYICVVPLKDFQIEQYKKRLPIWVNDYLSLYQGGCSDKEKAFTNWMERDALFASTVLSQAKELGYTTLVVDGSKTIDENFQFAVEVFGL